MTWNPLDEPYDKVWLAQVWSPGIADITGANSPRKWEEREPHGASGASLVFKGKQLAHFSVTLRLYTAQDWRDWELFKPLVDKIPDNKDPRALDIWHPILVDQGIFSAAVEDVGPPQQTDDGEWSIEIKFSEYREPKPTQAKLKGAKATPADPLQEELAALTKEQADLLANPPKVKLSDLFGGIFD